MRSIKSVKVTPSKALSPSSNTALFDVLANEATDWAAFTLNSKGSITSWNSGAERLLGFSVQDVVGEHFSMLFQGDDIKRAIPDNELQRSAELGRYESEGWAVRKGGSVFRAKTICVAVRSRGYARRFVRVIHDLTDQDAGDAALQLCLEVWDRFPQGLLVFCPDGCSGGRTFKVFAANAALLQIMPPGGPTIEELAGAHWSDLSEFFRPPPKQRDITKKFWSVIASGETKGLGRISCRRHDGSGEPIYALSAFPLSACCVGLLFDKAN